MSGIEKKLREKIKNELSSLSSLSFLSSLSSLSPLAMRNLPALLPGARPTPPLAPNSGRNSGSEFGLGIRGLKTCF